MTVLKKRNSVSIIPALVSLKEKCLSCQKCAIGGQQIDGHLSNVFSNMCIKARVMVVGQNPGAQEVKQGIPFVGPSGKFFDSAIEKVLGVDRSHFYISNTTRCFTPGNRKPSASEIANCGVFLEEEIATLKPSVVITLGAPAMEQITGRHGIMKLHGQIIKSPKYGVSVLPLLHPSPLNMRSADRRAMFMGDLEKLKPFVCRRSDV